KSKNPSDVISRLEALLSTEQHNQTQEREDTISVGQGAISLKESKKGVFSIKCDAKISDDIKQKIEAFIRAL
ncbi:hypothetical protein C9975_06710, partial [Thalassospira xiamenensis]